MKQDLLYIEAGEIEVGEDLFRGFGRLWPLLRWNRAAVAWKAYVTTNPQSEPWGELVTPREAERLFPGCTAAALPEGVPPRWRRADPLPARTVRRL